MAVWPHQNFLVELRVQQQSNIQHVAYLNLVWRRWYRLRDWQGRDRRRRQFCDRRTSNERRGTRCYNGRRERTDRKFGLAERL
jgi:hypothetical protein